MALSSGRDQSNLPVIGEPERAFIGRQRVGRLATADGSSEPHVVPICFALDADVVYTPIYRKPKKTLRLKRVRNIEETGRAALLFDRYDDDWSLLGWVLLRGSAALLEDGPELERAVELLRERYVQYRGMPLREMPVIAVRVEQCARWGNLRAG